MLQDADEYRSWALLGFLACPSALAGVGARGVLRRLLSEGLLLHIYEDVAEPLHPLFEAHVRPSLEKLTEVCFATVRGVALRLLARFGSAFVCCCCGQYTASGPPPHTRTHTRARACRS